MYRPGSRSAGRRHVTSLLLTLPVLWACIATPPINASSLTVGEVGWFVFTSGKGSAGFRFDIYLNEEPCQYRAKLWFDEERVE
jgi:hypothetical protein